MYEKFYGFSEKPFNTTPDSKFFFPSAKHTEALNSLIYAINERKGFVVITGEIGAGKTTVCRTLLNKLELNTRVATITNTHLTCKELIAEILEELEIEYKGGTKQKLLSHLNTYLIKQLAADINVVLIIDEAQNLTPTVLEEVRMLSNLETEKEKLIQIILLGQPQLKAKLENIRLEQFKQRIAVYYHLTGLVRNETQEYILHRLKLVSNNGYDFFTPRAMDLIYEHSKGIPRLINLICDSALLSGYVYEIRKITENIIQEVIRERDLSAAPPQSIKNEDVSVVSETKIYCCTDCLHYNNCDIKWIRGAKGEGQLCCQKCQDFQRCVDNVKKVKLN
jgi:general secretion pathway protein A